MRMGAAVGACSSCSVPAGWAARAWRSSEQACQTLVAVAFMGPAFSVQLKFSSSSIRRSCCNIELIHEGNSNASEKVVRSHLLLYEGCCHCPFYCHMVCFLWSHYLYCSCLGFSTFVFSVYLLCLWFPGITDRVKWLFHSWFLPGNLFVSIDVFCHMSFTEAQ